TSYNSLQEYVDSSQINISQIDDLETETWNEFVAQTSSFDSWESMKALALGELRSKHKEQVIEELCNIKPIQ
ncbi:hypothetical protein, partial [Catenovulum maritimum]